MPGPWGTQASGLPAVRSPASALSCAAICGERGDHHRQSTSDRLCVVACTAVSRRGGEGEMKDPETEVKGADCPSTTAVVVAWTCVGSFIAALGWGAVSEAIYVDASSSLPLQLLLGMLAALPSGLATFWLGSGYPDRRPSWVGTGVESTA